MVHRGDQWTDERVISFWLMSVFKSKLNICLCVGCVMTLGQAVHTFVHLSPNTN